MRKIPGPYSMQPGVRQYHDMAAEWLQNWSAGLFLIAFYTMVRAGPVGNAPGPELRRDATENVLFQNLPGSEL